MDLRERLRLLKAAGVGRSRSASADPSPSASRDGLDAKAPSTLGDRIQGTLRSTPAGQAFYVENHYPLEHRRGPVSLDAIFPIPGWAWRVLGRLAKAPDVRRAVFFDTETTGLAGGTGTYAFLIGIGFFQDNAFVIRQYFLRDYPEEEAMLQALAQDMSSFDLLVSFNGKSFDWPLLETRFRLNRLRIPLQGALHLDLLHPARRLWKVRLQQCSLTNLEAQILGERRQGDVPGHLIPPLYFDYLRSGDAGPLVGVMEHNRLDILSLVSLGAWMGQMVTDPLDTMPNGHPLSGDDLFALGRLFEARGHHLYARICCENALERGVEAYSRMLVQRELSRAYKRGQQHQQALSLWQEMAAARSLSLYPYVEMAKYYEHVAKDYRQALEMTQQALDVAYQRRSLKGPEKSILQEWHDLQHRLERLQRKLQKMAL